MNKVGNATRTKGQIRGSKSKGNQWEMDVEASLQQKYPICYRTHDRGFIKQYDLEDKDNHLAVECKSLRGISWNQAKKFWHKLDKVAPEGYHRYLIFKSNQQPPLVMYQQGDGMVVEEFETCFNIPFIKHTPIKRGNLK